MSGGVDSSVSALLLQQQGYEVFGVTLRLKPDEESTEGSCCSLEDVEDARRVCYKLGIEHVVFNFCELFRKEVIDYFAAEYAAGRTPNPCIACNRRIKFQAMLRRAEELGFDYIATGHYARRWKDEDGRYRLRKAATGKDQSYVLYSLTQEQLARTLFPLGEYEKSRARALAQQAGLPVANKPDSQEICFVPDNDYAAFLERYTGKSPEPGGFVDQSGKILGTHRGITRYTVGQRKGLGISFGEPMYVTKIDAGKNQVVLGPEGSQYSSELTADDLNWIAFENLTGELEVEAKVRYQAHPAPAVLYPLENGRVQVRFREPQRSVTPGQAVVFYHGDEVLGGGTILS